MAEKYDEFIKTTDPRYKEYLELKEIFE